MLSRDESGELTYREVTRVFRRVEAELTFTDAHGVVQHLVMTPEHPFHVAGAGWVPAGELAIGAEVVTAEGGGCRAGRHDPSHARSRDLAHRIARVTLTSMPIEARPGHTTIFFDAGTRTLGDVAAVLAADLGLPFVREADEAECFAAPEGELRVTLRRRTSPVPARVPARDRLAHELDVEGRDGRARLRLAHRAWRRLRGLGLRMHLVNDVTSAPVMTAAEQDAAFADLLAKTEAHVARWRAEVREECPSMTDAQIENNIRAALAIFGL